ncbi:hypothetical protein GY45DRAFT_1153051 [Cubamyces sp. BRFM 1775]|nr:hypothetical protein GY45DRAFT_1153051 [Cubamyces sp. BRFM 1775]
MMLETCSSMLRAAPLNRVWLDLDVLNLVKQVFGLEPVCCFGSLDRQCSCLEQDRACRSLLQPILSANPVACPLIPSCDCLLVLNQAPAFCLGQGSKHRRHICLAISLKSNSAVSRLHACLTSNHHHLRPQCNHLRYSCQAGARSKFVNGTSGKAIRIYVRYNLRSDAILICLNLLSNRYSSACLNMQCSVG